MATGPRPPLLPAGWRALRVRGGCWLLFPPGGGESERRGAPRIPDQCWLADRDRFIVWRRRERPRRLGPYRGGTLILEPGAPRPAVHPVLPAGEPAAPLLFVGAPRAVAEFLAARTGWVLHAGGAAWAEAEAALDADDNPAPAAARLAGALGGAPRGAREAAADALLRLGLSAIEPLSRLAMHPDEQTRRLAARLLVRAGPGAADAVADLVWHSSPAVRQIAAEGLAGHQELGLSRLLALLRECSAGREQVAEAILRLGADAVPGLLEQLDHADDEVRRAAVLALGRIGDPRALAPVRALLADRRSRVRAAAAEAAGELRDADALEALQRMYREDWTAVRLAAVTALGRIGGGAAVPELCRALEDLVMEVSAAAAAALGAIAEQEAHPGLRAALPLLRQRLRRWNGSSARHCFSAAIRTIEAATCDTRDLPTPARLPPELPASLPRPARGPCEDPADLPLPAASAEEP